MFGIFDVLGADLVLAAVQIDEHRILGPVHSNLACTKCIKRFTVKRFGERENKVNIATSI